RGRGITEYFGVDPKEVDVLMGTLSKSFGNSGGCIAGCKELVEYLKYTTPGFVFSLGLTPGSTAGSLAAIRLWEAEPERFVRLHENAGLFLGLAKQHGLNTGMSQNSPIVPIILGNSLDCMRLSQAMFTRGVSAMPIVHPAVEEGVARLRFFITSLHNEKQLRYTIDVMAEELRKINPDYLGGSK
ncbi:MAG: aminotransferase class I/II-fold pyridoxal phosphate-dependent enzyme, partial [Candidatus Nealsonbacteria bacterium]|nr:aminotransferase class I/II-fold pyridoxal phosphate-dependent enzyme [Candidatus Nealsonbacteria bacterium]